MSCNCGNNIKKTTCANHLTVDDQYRAVTLKDLEGYLKKDDYLKGWTASEQDIVRSNIGINEYRDLDDIYQLLIKRQALNDKDYIVINDADDDYKPKKVYIQDLFKYDDITFTSADDTITITETYDDTTRITTVDFSNPDHPQTLANTEAIELLQEKTDEIQDDLEATKTRVTTNERNIASLNSRQTIVEDRMVATEEDVADFKEEVRAKISCVYKFKGSVKTQYDLPPSAVHPEAPEIGDVWDIEEYSGDSPWHKAGDHWGMNVCWTGEQWDELGALVDHDIFEVIEHKITDWSEYEGDVFEDIEHYPSVKAMAEYVETAVLPTYADTDSVSITENDGEVSADVNIVPLNNAISITEDGLYVEPRYTDPEIDLLLGAKADKATTYTKSEVDDALSTKANADSVYTKTEVDTALDTKSDKTTTYTKTEIDTALQNYALKESVIQISSVDLIVPQDNTHYVSSGDISNLSINDATQNTSYWIEFTVGNTSPTIITSGISWVDGRTPDFSLTNVKWQVAIINGCGVAGWFNI